MTVWPIPERPGMADCRVMLYALLCCVVSEPIDNKLDITTVTMSDYQIQMSVSSSGVKV